MENQFQSKIEKAMKKFEGRKVKVTLSGIIESKFYIKNLEYCIEEGILQLEEGNDTYLDLDIDDIESLYFQYSLNGFALLVLDLVTDLQIKLQVNENNVVSIKGGIKWERKCS